MKKKIDTDKSIIYKSISIRDLAEATHYLEQNGYFSDTPDFNTYHYGELNEIIVSYHHEYAFFGIGNDFETSFKYFIPEENVYFEIVNRPYCFLGELPFKLGDEIALRFIQDKHVAMYKFTGYSIKLDDALGAIIDKLRFTQVGKEEHGLFVTPEELMDQYEVRIKDEWQAMSVDA